MLRPLAILCLTALPAAADMLGECEGSSRTAVNKTGAVFTQTLACGDGSADITFTCRKGDKRVVVRVPFAAHGARRGSLRPISIGIAGGSETLRLKVVVSSPDDSFGVGEFRLAVSGKLWKAMAKAGSRFTVTFNGLPVDLGLLASAATDLTRFRKACGLN